MNRQVIKEQGRFNKFLKMATTDNNILFPGALLQKAVKKFPNTCAIIYKDKKYSYKDLYYYAYRLSKKLAARGIKKHDKVVLCIENSIEFYISYFAVWQVGAIVVPVNTFLKKQEFSYIIEDAKPSLIITTSDKNSLLPINSVSIVLVEEVINLDIDISAIVPHFDIPTFEKNELVALLYTSGTTGKPKGVMLSSKNIITNLIQALSRMPFEKGQKIFCVLPLFHSFAQNTCIWAAIFSGCTIIVVPKIDRRAILHNLSYKPTIFLGIPALYGLLCLLKTAPLESIEYFISGGDALSDKIRMGFELIYRRKICNGYGLTETSPLISVDLDDYRSSTNTVGRPVVNVTCQIRDGQGKEVQHGRVGMLWIKGDNVMIGYYNAQKETEKVLQDGWFKTGDLAKYNADGKLVICGRDKDLIIHKGFNIYPQEVENIIYSHKDVMFVGIVGKKDDELGEIPIAFIQLRPAINNKNIEKELRSLCREKCATYKIPKQFIIVEVMPLTATKKVDKKELRKKLF